MALGAVAIAGGAQPPVPRDHFYRVDAGPPDGAFTTPPLRGAVMVEDIARNLVPAAALGMTTVWVRTDNAWGAEGSGGGHIHHVIDDVADWLAVLAG